MSPEQKQQMFDINSEVNKIPYNEISGSNEPPDWWTDQVMAGNSWVCRDYVQMKADKLKDLGWGSDSLSTILCYVEDPPGGYHAVLGLQVKDDNDIWICDSRVDEPYLMSKPPLKYTWDRKQIAGSVDFQSIA